MFDRVQHQLAREFTIITFLVLLFFSLVNIPSEYGAYLSGLDDNILQDAEQIILSLDSPEEISVPKLRPRDAARTRILAPDYSVLYEGSVLVGQPVHINEEVWTFEVDSSLFRVLLVPILYNDSVLGYLQVAEEFHLWFDDLPVTILITLVESALIAVLVYFIGSWFARRSLQPAVESYEQLERFAGNVSHELRTPLAVIQSAVDLSIKEQKTDALETAVSSLQRANHLIERLLRLSSIQQSTFQPVETDVGAIVDDIIAEQQVNAAARQVELAAELAEYVQLVADPALLYSYVTNIVSNAIKFTPPGKKVTVSLTTDSFEVSDEGVGMSDTEKTKIFEPFYSGAGKKNETGFGLGLSICKKIADLHDWQIKVESRVNEGTVITTWF